MDRESYLFASIRLSSVLRAPAAHGLSSYQLNYFYNDVPEALKRRLAAKRTRWYENGFGFRSRNPAS